ncbi:conserved hypothetical protein [Histoplasma capsulatum var. duboisii H88]|uniref:Uncharacterized protein n=1 Tax=Ajellomyces capsulatus (strain H88) TaxID=544711 RepID=F0UFX0_AJEC8|nr:conserved hypothetical protein [Histoplasma capsulatum var. duboisii H88]
MPYTTEIPLQYRGDSLPGSLLAWARDLMTIGSNLLAALRTVSDHQAARIHDLEDDILWLIELLRSNNIAFPPSTPLHYDLAVDTHESRPLQQGDVRYFRWEMEEFAAFASALEENNDEVEGEIEGQWVLAPVPTRYIRESEAVMLGAGLEPNQGLQLGNGQRRHYFVSLAMCEPKKQLALEGQPQEFCAGPPMYTNLETGTRIKCPHQQLTRRIERSPLGYQNTDYERDVGILHH